MDISVIHESSVTCMAGIHTSSFNFIYSLEEELHLLLVQPPKLDVFFRDPFFGERMTAFVAVVKIVDHYLGAHMKFLDKGVIHIASLAKISDINGSLPQSAPTFRPYFLAARCSSLVRIEQLWRRMKRQR